MSMKRSQIAITAAMLLLTVSVAAIDPKDAREKAKKHYDDAMDNIHK